MNIFEPTLVEPARRVSTTRKTTQRRHFRFNPDAPIDLLPVPYHFVRGDDDEKNERFDLIVGASSEDLLSIDGTACASKRLSPNRRCWRAETFDVEVLPETPPRRASLRASTPRSADASSPAASPAAPKSKKLPRRLADWGGLSDDDDDGDNDDDDDDDDDDADDADDDDDDVYAWASGDEDNDEDGGLALRPEDGWPPNRPLGGTSRGDGRRGAPRAHGIYASSIELLDSCGFGSPKSTPSSPAKSDDDGRQCATDDDDDGNLQEDCVGASCLMTAPSLW